MESGSLLEKAILAAVFKGYTTEGEILELLRGVDPEIVRTKLRELVARGLLREVERGFLVFKRREFMLTEKGVAEAEKALGEIKAIASDMARRRREGLGEVAEDLAVWLLPFAAALGLIAFMDLMDDAVVYDVEEAGFEDAGEGDFGDLEL